MVDTTEVQIKLMTVKAINGTYWVVFNPADGEDNNIKRLDQRTRIMHTFAAGLGRHDYFNLNGSTPERIRVVEFNDTDKQPARTYTVSADTALKYWNEELTPKQYFETWWGTAEVVNESTHQTAKKTYVPSPNVTIFPNGTFKITEEAEEGFEGGSGSGGPPDDGPESHQRGPTLPDTPRAPPERSGA